VSAGYVVRVEADARDRRQLDDVFHRLAADDSVQLLSAGFDEADAPLAVHLLCGGTEADARGNAQAAVTAALRSLGFDAAATVVRVDLEPERPEGPPWFALVNIGWEPGADARDRLLEALLADGRIHGGSASVSDGDDAATAFFAVDCPRVDVEDVALSLVSDALRRVGIDADTVQLGFVAHPDGGPG
jgi:hypothetical protein